MLRYIVHLYYELSLEAIGIYIESQPEPKIKNNSIILCVSSEQTANLCYSYVCVKDCGFICVCAKDWLFPNKINIKTSKNNILETSQNDLSR